MGEELKEFDWEAWRGMDIQYRHSDLVLENGHWVQDDGQWERRTLLWLWRLFVLVGGGLLMSGLFMGAAMVQVNGVAVLRVVSFWLSAAVFGFTLTALVFATVKARG